MTQHYTIFFITVNALHVSGGFSALHQELKTVHTASGMSSLLAATASQNVQHYITLATNKKSYCQVSELSVLRAPIMQCLAQKLT
jgi:hypothetical protein